MFAAKPQKTKSEIGVNSMVGDDKVTNQKSFRKKKIKQKWLSLKFGNVQKSWFFF